MKRRNHILAEKRSSRACQGAGDAKNGANLADHAPADPAGGESVPDLASHAIHAAAVATVENVDLPSGTHMYCSACATCIEVAKFSVHCKSTSHVLARCKSQTYCGVCGRGGIVTMRDHVKSNLHMREEYALAANIRSVVGGTRLAAR